MTNREKLNAMSNDELLTLLDCQCCIYRSLKGTWDGCGDCVDGIKKWLESEVN